ncbi:MAG: thiolase domain-containing protein [Thermoanaerobaculia bacterium]
MSDVFILGVGQTRVGEHWDSSLRELGAAAIRAALDDARIESVEALYAGNMLGGCVNRQENVATLLTDAAGLLPAEAWKIEAACASGDAVAAGLATASDQDFEASHGLSFVALSALMMQRYMHETGQPREAFAPFAVNAHANAVGNPHAMFRDPITTEDFARSPVVASPIGVLDAAPVCDGAAAVVVGSRRALEPHHRPIKIAASAAATDTIGLAARADILTLGAAKQSAERVFEVSGFKREDIDFFEAHDAFTIITALSLESCGFVPRGEALKHAADGCFMAGGCTPVSTFGGLKARGHPVGASGTYQIVEAALQLRAEAGANQVAGARRAMTQSIGGHGSIAVTHLLEA